MRVKKVSVICVFFLVFSLFSNTTIAADKYYWIFSKEIKQSPPKDYAVPYPQSVFIQFSNIIYFPTNNNNGDKKECYAFFRNAPEDENASFHLTAKNPKIECRARQFSSISELVTWVKRLRYTKLPSTKYGYAIEDGRYSITSGAGDRRYFSHNENSREIDLAGNL